MPLLTMPGEAMDVKVTLIGRPGAVKLLANCVVTTMQPTRGPSLPRGLPTLPAQSHALRAVYEPPPLGQRGRAVTGSESCAGRGRVGRLQNCDIPVLAVYAMRVHTELSQVAKQRQQQEQPQ